MPSPFARPSAHVLEIAVVMARLTVSFPAACLCLAYAPMFACSENHPLLSSRSSTSIRASRCPHAANPALPVRGWQRLPPAAWHGTSWPFRGLSDKLWPAQYTLPPPAQLALVARWRSACREERASPKAAFSATSLACLRLAVFPPARGHSRRCLPWGEARTFSDGGFRSGRLHFLIVPTCQGWRASAIPNLWHPSVPLSLRTWAFADCARRPILQAQVRSNQSSCSRLISLGFHINPPVLQFHARS
jgi:hypothetical protein